MNPLDPLDGAAVGAEAFVAFQEIALSVQIEVQFRKEQREAVGVFQLVLLAIPPGHHQPVRLHAFAAWEPGFENPPSVHRLHRGAPPAFKLPEDNLPVERSEHAHHQQVSPFLGHPLGAKHRVRGAVIAAHHGCDLCLRQGGLGPDRGCSRFLGGQGLRRGWFSGSAFCFALHALSFLSDGCRSATPTASGLTASGVSQTPCGVQIRRTSCDPLSRTPALVISINSAVRCSSSRVWAPP